MKVQVASLPFTLVFVALVVIINTKVGGWNMTS